MSAPSMPQYRIRRDDGSELAVPWAAALALLVRRGDIRPDTVIFDAGKGVWSKACDSPVVKFIIEDIAWSGQKLPEGWSTDPTGAVAAAPTGPSAELPKATPAPATQPPGAAPASPAAGSPASPAASKAPRAAVTPAPAAPEAATQAKASPATARPGDTNASAPSTAAASSTRPGLAAATPTEPSVAPPPSTAATPVKATPTPTPPTAATPGKASAAPRSSTATAESVSAAATSPAPAAPVAASPTASATAKVSPAQQETPAHTPAAKPAGEPAPVGSTAPGQRAAWEQVRGDDPDETLETAAPTMEVHQHTPRQSASRFSPKQKLVFVSSFVGTAAVAVGLGFALRGRDPGAQSVAAATLPVTVFSPGFSQERLGVDTFSEGGFSPVAQLTGRDTSSGIQAPARPIPLPKPEIPLLADSQVANELARAGAVVTANAAVDLPPPPSPDRPADIAYDVAPQVRNAGQIRQALEREYPIGLRETGIGGRVEMNFDIDDQGGVKGFRVKEGSGHAALDQAALRVAEVFEFTPARRRNERVAASISLGITFDSRMSAPAAGNAVRAPAPASASTDPAREQGGGADPNQPVATAYDVAPKVLNTNQVRQELERQYPIGLRAAGIGGRVEVWFHITEQGAIEAVQVKQSSGNRALDEAALRVARVFRFEPAQRGGQAIEVWVPLGITFQAR